MKRIGIVIAALFAFLVIAVAVLLFIDAHPRVYRFPIQSAGVLTEPEAISVTREAIAASGRDSKQFSSLAWGTREHEGVPERTLARNTINPNNGYVIWKHTSGDPVQTVRVSIEKWPEEFRCSVHEAK